jgi:YkoY family integral membrane protein
VVLQKKNKEINKMISTILIIANIFLLEILLSIDNTTVLAIMAKHLPYKEGKKALTYGIFGAYFFRGLCLLFVSFLTNLWFLKLLGGIYLIYLSLKELKPKGNSEDGTDDVKDKSWQLKLKNSFWGTVILVEIMDLAFSIDNVFAAVAMSNNYWIVFTGVCIGITAIRFISQFFIKIIQKYQELETAAFIAILLLGLKMTAYSIARVKENENINLIFSLLILLVFFGTFIYSKIKNQSKN